VRSFFLVIEIAFRLLEEPPQEKEIGQKERGEKDDGENKIVFHPGAAPFFKIGFQAKIHGVPLKIGFQAKFTAFRLK
jgi:hypothetical protein